MNRRHMIDDHYGPSAGRANLLFRAVDGILGTHRWAAQRGVVVMTEDRTVTDPWGRLGEPGRSRPGRGHPGTVAGGPVTSSNAGRPPARAGACCCLGPGVRRAANSSRPPVCQRPITSAVRG
jgi:hypothetical protein